MKIKKNQVNFKSYYAEKTNLVLIYFISMHIYSQKGHRVTSFVNINLSILSELQNSLFH